MTYSYRKHIFFIIISSFIFLLDIVLFSFFQSHILYPLLCYFIVLIFQRRSNRFLIIPLLFLSCLSYLDCEIFGWCLVYLVPTMAFAYYLDKQLRVKIIIPYSLLFFALLLKIILMLYMLNIDISWIYALQLFFYNSMILSCFITTWKCIQKKIELDATKY